MSDTSNYAMIMAGGSGTRLWPVSRASSPKQLVRFIPGDDGPRSLLHIAAERITGVVDDEKRLICTNEAYRDEIKRTIPGFSDEQILGEPVGRDTVNAIGLTAAVLHRRDAGAVFAVLTADHLIEPVKRFRERLGLAFDLVKKDAQRLVTFSVTPTYPATGFGYVERSASIEGSGDLAFRVERFVEKPSVEKAQAYVDSGAFGWNSGMFVWSAATFLDCLRRYKPESHAGLMKIADAWDTDERAKVLGEVYPELPKISVDYAIMEPASREQARSDDGVKVVTVALDIDWLDVGSWPSFGETLDADGDGNRVAGDCAYAHLYDAKGTMIVNYEPGHHVAVVGAEDLIIVHTPDATLVMPREKAQDLKSLHGGLPEEIR